MNARSVIIKALPAVVVLALLIIAPFLKTVEIPGLLGGPIGSPGTIQLLAIGLIYASLAMSFDILFGYTGMLSFGHTLWFALGLYLPTVLMRDTGMDYVPAVAISLLTCAVLSVLLGSVALRTYGIAFAMVTLTFAEAFHIFVERNPTGAFGGDEGLQVPSEQLPDAFRGVVGIQSVYWVTLIFAVVVYLILRQAVKSRAGHVWRGLAENPTRIEMVGLRPYRYRMMAFVISACAAALAGSIYLLVVKFAFPAVTSSNFALVILVMVTLGGSGRLWGAALGGFIYGVVSVRLTSLSTTPFGEGWPKWLEGPLHEPQFYVGVGLLLIMFFVPDGLSGLYSRISDRLRRRERATTTQYEGATR